MTFKCGWQAGSMFAVMTLFFSFLLRLGFGNHTLIEAGTETLIFSAFCGVAYSVGYYRSFTKYSDDRLLLSVFSAGVLMFAIGVAISYLIPAAFTSMLWLCAYSIFAMFMSWLGFEDQSLERWERYLQEHDMA